MYCDIIYVLQFMCTAIICAVYVYCGYCCSLCVLRLLVQFMCTAINGAVYAGVSKWAGTFTRLRSCIVPAEITEPPKISGGQNHKYDGRQAYGIFFIKN